MKKIEEIEQISIDSETTRRNLTNRIDEFFKIISEELRCPERRLRGMTSKEWADFLEKREAENEKDRRNDVA